MSILLITEKHIYQVSLVKRGCEKYARYKLGKVSRYGENTDLSLLGTEVFEWQEVGINVRNKKAEIVITGKKAYQETFREDFGEIVGITYLFDGKGTVDYVELSDVNETSIFRDDFDR